MRKLHLKLRFALSAALLAAAMFFGMLLPFMEADGFGLGLSHGWMVAICAFFLVAHSFVAFSYLQGDKSCLKVDEAADSDVVGAGSGRLQEAGFLEFTE